jgi:uncharacterized protein
LRPVQFAAAWQTASGLSTLPISETHQVVFNPANPVRVAILNDAARQILNKMSSGKSVIELSGDFPDLEPAQIHSTVEKLVFLRLIEPQGSLTESPQIQPAPVLTAWLHLTDRCNLRCDYCYLPHKLEDMSSQTGKEAIEATFRAAQKNGYQRVKLKFAGGEPFLRFDLMMDLQAHAKTLQAKSHLKLESVVLSNGTLLTPKRVAALKAAGIRLMISLDGLSEQPHPQRHDAAGCDSSAQALRGIEIALQSGLKPEISITVSARNADGLAQLVEWVLTRDLPFRLNFYRENDLSASMDSLALADEKIIAGMRAAFQVVEAHLPSHNLLASLLDRANLSAPHEKTCSASDDYIVFGPDGRVSQCPMLLNKSFGEPQAMEPLAFIRGQAGLRNLPVQQKQACRSCQWRYWCAGGCPIMTHRATGSYAQKSPSCGIYQALFPQLLRLEGLRLLQARQ